MLRLSLWLMSCVPVVSWNLSFLTRVREAPTGQRVIVTEPRPLEEPPPAPPAEDAEEPQRPPPLPRSLPAACRALAPQDGVATVNGKPVPPDSCVGGFAPIWGCEQ